MWEVGGAVVCLCVGINARGEQSGAGQWESPRELQRSRAPRGNIRHRAKPFCTHCEGRGRHKRRGHGVTGRIQQAHQKRHPATGVLKQGRVGWGAKRKVEKRINQESHDCSEAVKQGLQSPKGPESQYDTACARMCTKWHMPNKTTERTFLETQCGITWAPPFAFTDFPTGPAFRHGTCVYQGPL